MEMNKDQALFRLEQAAATHLLSASEELTAAIIAAEGAGFQSTAERLVVIRAELNSAIQHMP